MGDLSKDQIQLVQKHTYAFTALCATDFKFAFYPASMIASACFLTALDGVNNSNSAKYMHEIATLTKTDVECLSAVKCLVEDLFKRESGHVEPDFELEYNLIDSPLKEEKDDGQEDFFYLDFDDSVTNLDEHCTYDELIKGFEDSNSNHVKEPVEISEDCLKKLRFDVTSDSLFDCINELNLNDDYVAVRSNLAVNSTKKKTKTSQSSRSSVSSDSSGVSSTASGFTASSVANQAEYLSYLNKSCAFQLTPPLANLLPMPEFTTETDTVTKKKPLTRSRRKQSLCANKLELA